jgi:polyol permease family
MGEILVSKKRNIPLVEKIGIPQKLFWGYIAVLLFMIGDGVESNYLAPYLAKNGFTMDSAATIISFYGITVTIGSWLAGSLSTILGPRKVMMVGGIIWVILEILFLAIALPMESFALTSLFYGLRGIAYPMFAYAFLVWIQTTTREELKGSATGWFWLAFTAGLPTLGSAVAVFSIRYLGEYNTFWTSLVLVVIGVLIGAFAIKERKGYSPFIDIKEENTTVAKEMLRGIDIIFRNPKVLIAGIVRVINTAPYYGFFVFLPFFFTEKIGFSQEKYLMLVTIMGLVGMSFNPIVGKLSDKFGWRKTLTFFGGIGSAIGTLLMFFVPQFASDNYFLIVLVACLYGITLCGYVPLAAIFSSIADRKDKGNSLAIYCLSAGVSTLLGPLLYRLLNNFIGIEGIVFIYASLYLVSAVLSWFFLKTPEDPGEKVFLTHSNSNEKIS